MSGAPQPLAGVRVLAVEQYGAAPYGTMFLAQLGADVIKIENPRGGDTARAVGPHFLAEGDSLYFQTFNLNKRSLTLDLKAPDGRDLFRRLAERADAVVNNLRGDLPAKLGIDYPSLADANPAIVCAHISAYGRTGERATWPGYDYLMQAEAGFLHLTGEPGTPPSRFGLSMVDFMTGTTAMVGLLAALLDARVSGRGRDVDVDLLSAALHQLSYPGVWYMNEGDVTPRVPRSAHPSVTPSQLFRTADGWIFVMAQLPKFWGVLCEALRRPDFATDPRYATPAARLANREALTELLDAEFERQSTEHWFQLLGGKMPVAPVRTLPDALDNPFLDAIGIRARVDHPKRDGIAVLTSPIRIDGERLPARAGPELGADTDAILAELGVPPGEVERLRAGGVV